MGYEVIFSAFSGLAGSPLPYDGFKILPSVFEGDPFGASILGEHFRRERADFIITLCDIWALEPQHLKGLPVAHWMPVDCSPLSMRDEQCLKVSGAFPIAMSRFGQRMLTEAGHKDVPYVPHGIDLDLWKPTLDRDEARRQLGVDGLFTIGINAANKDAFRKGMAEQYEAFARFHAKHPDSALLVHSVLTQPSSLDLRVLEQRLNLSGAVRYVDQYALLTGQVPDEHLVNWYSALDLYSACSFGEGFCLPVAEALACGVPVVATDCSALAEDVAAGQWLVKGESFWNPTHGAWWVKPDIGGIVKAYEQAYNKGPSYQAKQAKARRSVERFDVDRVAEEHWAPVLEMLQAKFCPPVTLTEPQQRAEGAPEVSVCFASRGRPEALKETVAGLLSLAAEPDAVEILIAADPDDTATHMVDLPAQARVVVAPERYGYTNLHRYLNALAEMAVGKWVMWWNDDFSMITHGWDKVVRANRPAILWPHANHVHHANIAPIWPKAWSDAMGHVSITTHMDTYLQRLGEALGRHDPVAIEIVHDRPDVTGREEDATYAEGRKLLGPEGMAPGFDVAYMHENVAIDAEIIRGMLG
jgi:glycosyltransferase involved in cell wall biosynthesis